MLTVRILEYLVLVGNLGIAKNTQNITSSTLPPFRDKNLFLWCL